MAHVNFSQAFYFSLSNYQVVRASTNQVFNFFRLMDLNVFEQVLDIRWGVNTKFLVCFCFVETA